MRPRSSGIRQRSQSAVPSVAQTRVDGSRVASRTAAMCCSFQSETYHDAECARNARIATASPASDASEIVAVEPRRVDVRLRQKAVERDGKDRRAGEGEPDHAPHGLHRADERHGEHGELVDRQPAAAATEREEQRRRRARGTRTAPSSRSGSTTAIRGGSARTARRRASGCSSRRASCRTATRARRAGRGRRAQRGSTRADGCARARRSRAAPSGRRRARPSRGGSPRGRAAAARGAFGV